MDFFFTCYGRTMKSKNICLKFYFKYSFLKDKNLTIKYTMIYYILAKSFTNSKTLP